MKVHCPTAGIAMRLAAQIPTAVQEGEAIRYTRLLPLSILAELVAKNSDCDFDQADRWTSGMDVTHNANVSSLREFQSVRGVPRPEEAGQAMHRDESNH